MCCKAAASSKAATRASLPSWSAAVTARPTPREAAMSAVIDFPVKPEARPYLDAFADDASEPDWLRKARRVSLNRFAELGFPSRRSENWRYLDLRTLEQHPMLPSVMRPVMGAPDGLALPASAARVVLVDGRFAPELSCLDLPDGVWLGSTQTAIEERPELVKSFAADTG